MKFIYQSFIFVEYKGKATVPGNIFQDLVNNGFIDENSEFADVNNSWVGRNVWIYKKKFNGKFIRDSFYFLKF